jgi:hypothetical protein
VTTSAATAVPSFTQPIRVGSDVSGQSSLYIQSVLVFDSNLTAMAQSL